MIKNKFRISYNNHFGLAPKKCRNFFLIQAGESLCAKDTTVFEHDQQYFEITFVRQGKGLSFVNGVPTAIEKGDCFFSFPNEKHMLTADEHDPMRFVFLAFYAKEKSSGDTLMRYILHHCKAPDARKHHIESLAGLCDSFLLELKNEDVYSSRVLSFLLEQILIECSRTISQKTKTYPTYNLTDESILVHDIITYIDIHILSMRKLRELEKVFYYNINHLSHCFHNQTGIPIRQYFIEKKMQTALNLLEKGESVTKISEQLGYSSVHSFSRSYKKHFGVPPSQQKKKN